MKYVHRHRAVLLLAMILTAVPIGCGIGPWLAWQMTPAETVEAQYEPPEGMTILVFPDDILHPIHYEPVKRILASEMNRYLIERKVAAAIIPYQNLADLEVAIPEFSRLSVSEVGQKLGADLVLYVQVDEFSLKDSDANPLWHGKLATTVRMIEVNKGLIWPKDRPCGWPVEPLDIPTSETARTYDTGLARILAERMAERIVNLFSKHSVQHGPRLAGPTGPPELPSPS